MGLKDNAVMIGSGHIESPDVRDFPGHFFNDFFRQKEIIRTKKTIGRAQD
jgi:hypothetical protein